MTRAIPGPAIPASLRQRPGARCGDPLSNRLRARLARREDGYIAITAMGIMLLLLGTSLLVVGAARVNIITAREGRAFTESRQAMEDAFAAATTGFNYTHKAALTSATEYPPAVTTPFGGSHNEVGSMGRDGRGVWNWQYVPTTRQVRAWGEVGGTVEEATRAVRGKVVGSKRATPDGTVVYGVAANGSRKNGLGAWGAVLSSAVDSTVGGTFYKREGTITPDVALYGASTLDLTGSAGEANAIYYSNDAEVDGTAKNKTRSAFTASFDFNRLNERVAEVTPTYCGTRPVTGLAMSTSIYACSSGSLSLPGALTASTGGVKTLVVKGNLNIPYDLNFTGSAQVHIYVSGNVRFSRGGAASATRTLNNVFIYAPNGTCKNDTGVSVALEGAMACNALNLSGNSNRFTHVIPGGDSHPTGRASDLVYFTEPAGYVDSLGN